LLETVQMYKHHLQLLPMQHFHKKLNVLLKLEPLKHNYQLNQ